MNICFSGEQKSNIQTFLWLKKFQKYNRMLLWVPFKVDLLLISFSTHMFEIENQSLFMSELKVFNTGKF